MKAFPIPRYVNSEGITYDARIQGMDLRDYFAAKAMQGIIGNSNENLCNFTMSEMVKNVYVIADAMMLARKEPLK